MITAELLDIFFLFLTYSVTEALCTIWSHGTKLHILVSKLRSGTSKTKTDPGGLVQVALFCKSHWATCSPACVILWHVTGSSIYSHVSFLMRLIKIIKTLILLFILLHLYGVINSQ